MAISKIIYKTSPQDTGTVWMDATPATAAAADILAPKTAMLADGVMTTGTGSGGGGGGLTLLATDEVTVSTTSTTATDIKTITVPSSTWASDKIVMVKITDKAGERNGYFWGHIGTLAADMPPNVGGEQNTTSKLSIFKTAAGALQTSNNATGYGLYFYSLTHDYNTGTVTVKIRVRYNSSFSQTIDGTYAIEVYAIDIDPFS